MTQPGNIPATATATLAGMTRTVAIDPANVREHRAALGVTTEQAVQIEATVAVAALLVEERCTEQGPAAGNALALRLDALTIDTMMALATA